ncbi:hypothetical protein BC628DRAFT_1192428 [Trametes gibbosa]|nr:hypothetical protein BC628DRAFT_1192428 [Trametes gibbosa]
MLVDRGRRARGTAQRTQRGRTPARPPTARAEDPPSAESRRPHACARIGILVRMREPAGFSHHARARGGLEAITPAFPPARASIFAALRMAGLAVPRSRPRDDEVRAGDEPRRHREGTHKRAAGVVGGGARDRRLRLNHSSATPLADPSTSPRKLDHGKDPADRALVAPTVRECGACADGSPSLAPPRADCF